MSAPNLVQQAQLEGRLRYAPQQAQLVAALGQAIADRNSAIHAAATAYTGLSGAIHRAGPQIRNNFREAAQSTASTDAITGQALAGAGSSPGGDAIRVAAAREGAVGGAIVAKALASRLTDLSDRRIAAAAGRVFSVNQAQASYGAARDKVNTQAANVAQQEGLFAQTRYGQLQQHQADQQFQANLQSQRLHSQAVLEGRRLASQQAVAGAALGARNHNAALSRRQQKLGRIDRAKLQSQRLSAQTRTTGTKAANAGASFRTQVSQAFQHTRDLVGTNDPKTIRHYLITGLKTKDVSIPAAKDVDAVNAGVELATQGHLSPQTLSALQSRGIPVPQQWTPIQVRAHVRKRAANGR